MKKQIEKLKRNIVILLRSNFDKFYVRGKTFYGKGEVQLQCEIIAELVLGLFESALLEAIQATREETKKFVVVEKKHSVGEDEAWCEWFRCPICSETMIYPRAKYCPECGVKLRFSKNIRND